MATNSSRTGPALVLGAERQAPELQPVLAREIKQSGSPGTGISRAAQVRFPSQNTFEVLGTPLAQLVHLAGCDRVSASHVICHLLTTYWLDPEDGANH